MPEGHSVSDGESDASLSTLTTLSAVLSALVRTPGSVVPVAADPQTGEPLASDESAVHAAQAEAPRAAPIAAVAPASVPNAQPAPAAEYVPRAAYAPGTGSVPTAAPAAAGYVPTMEPAAAGYVPVSEPVPTTAPAPVVEPVAAVEPAPVVEPVVVVEPAPVVEVVAAAEPILTTEPAPTPELPAAQEPSAALGPIPTLEPDTDELAPEPAPATEPDSAPAPAPTVDAAPAPEPSAVEEPAAEPVPATEPASPPVPAEAPHVPAGLTGPALGSVPHPSLPADNVPTSLRTGILTSPAGSWAGHLDPTQAVAAYGTYAGPCLIRGVVGTGKTVVALHRAIHLARSRPGRVLVTALVPTVPDLLRRQIGQIAPDVVGRIDFIGLHAFAVRLLLQRGIRLEFNGVRVTEVRDEAWRAVGRRGLVLEVDTDRAYWEEEIAAVIQGNGVQSLEEYLALPRTGRRHELDADKRTAVWALHRATAEGLARQHVQTLADVVLLAESELRRAPLDEAYSAVIVDDAQDLSVAMLRTLRLLAPDGPDGLTVIGDARAPLYPGGATLADAGIEIDDRTVTLRLHQRSTAQILYLAGRVADEADAPSLNGPVDGGAMPRTAPRSGPEPLVEHCASRSDATDRLVGRVRAIAADGGTAAGHVAVLAMTHDGARRAATALRAEGIAVVKIDEGDDVGRDGVVVGTIKRAAGLEFTHVLLPDVPRTLIEGDAPPTGVVANERFGLARREVLVAMTRARDGLWVGVV